MEQSPQVPRVADADSLLVWTQPLAVTALLVLSLLTVQDLGRTPVGTYLLALLVLSALYGYSRSVPDRWLPLRFRFVLAVPAAVAAGLLFGGASDSFAIGFAYLFSGHVGFRFRTRGAALLVTLNTVAAVLAITVLPRSPDAHWLWWTALTVGLPVLTGVARQNRMQTLAYAAALVETSRRAASLESEAATFAERNRIARELHDVLAHALSGVSVQLDNADAMIEAGRIEEGRAGLQRARELTVEGLVQARGAVASLRDDEIDLAAALSGSVTGAEVLRVASSLDDVPPSVARAALRIVQEALTNARRHAPGAAVAVDVSRSADGHELLLSVVNGAPPLPTQPFTLGSGQGLIGVGERAAALGGSVSAGPRQPNGDPGWTVSVRLPVDRAPEDPR